MACEIGLPCHQVVSVDFSLDAELASDELLISVVVKATIIASTFVVVKVTVAAFFEVIMATIVIITANVAIVVFVNWMGPEYFT